MTNREKLTVRQLKNLLNYIMEYAPFQIELDTKPKMTIKQFCEEIAKEISYHRTLDKEKGIA